jgi:mannose-6-phosphate isomerase-like protein (cupin superfamily)
MLRRVTCTRVAFPALPWTQGNHPLERKKVGAGRPVALLEFAPGFADPNWCERSHVIYVCSGALEIELRDRVERFAAGECCVIDAGTPHRASNPGTEPVTAFIASEIEVRP